MRPLFFLPHPLGATGGRLNHLHYNAIAFDLDDLHARPRHDIAALGHDVYEFAPQPPPARPAATASPPRRWRRAATPVPGGSAPATPRRPRRPPSAA